MPDSPEPTLPAVDPTEGLRRTVSRRAFVTGVAVAAGAGAVSLGTSPAAASDGHAGMVTSSPKLPRGFAGTFRDRFVRANGQNHHVVIGGDGPPLLLIHGWPQNWYAWRLIMMQLAQDFTVVAVDQRGIGASDRPSDGYDAGTLAMDQAAVMETLGHTRFAVVGHDTGYIIGYALASDYAARVARIALLEIPGPPGVGELPYGPPYFLDEATNNKLWHIPFNRVNNELIINMVRSNAREYYQYEFDIQGGGVPLSSTAIRYYIELYNRSKATLRSSFGLYRAWDATVAQNIERGKTPLPMPVLGIGGELSWGPAAGGALTGSATDLQVEVIPKVGHWLAEQAPAELLALLTAFLNPYHDSY